jgi:molybdopterin molybdotransferase
LPDGSTIERVEPESGTGGAPCAATIDFDTAQAILAEGARPLGTERVTIENAGGRTLAEPVTAGIDAPRRDCSAMDGFAVREADLAAGMRVFRLAGTSYAGGQPGADVGPGEAFRIMTGAPLPQGADRVLVAEQVVCQEERVRLVGEPPRKPHVRRRGSDFREGDVLLGPGRVLDSRALVVAAAADRDRVAVWRRPRLHVIASGDELAAPGSSRGCPNSTPESLGHAILHMGEQWGAEPAGVSRLSDDPDMIRQAAADALGFSDLVAVVGGAARGDRDFAKAGLAPLGLEIGFADVAMRPGKPVWYGRIGHPHVLGLPGNPTAAMTVARLFLAPLVSALAGRGASAALSWQSRPAEAPLPPGGPREAFLCAAGHEGGVLLLDRQEASSQWLLASAEFLLRRPAFAPEVARGVHVPTLAF